MFNGFSYDVRRLIIGRTVSDWASSITLTLSVYFSPVSQAITITRLTAFITPLFSYYIIDEKVCFLEMLSITGGSFGILLIMNP